MRITESQLRKIVREQLETAAMPPPVSEQQFDEFYVIGYWSNPYRSGDKEYFWSGPYDTREEASFAGKRKQERGQPKRFTNWGKGQNRIINGTDKFKAEAAKVGLNPVLDY